MLEGAVSESIVAVFMPSELLSKLEGNGFIQALRVSIRAKLWTNMTKTGANAGTGYIQVVTLRNKI